MLKIFGVLAAAALTAVTVSVIPALGAPGPSGTPLPTGNACANPVLETKSTGWSTRSGGSGQRVTVADHVAADHARQTTSRSSTVVVNLPQVAVYPGERWTFATDSRIDTGGTVRVAVEWRDADSEPLGHADGAAVTMGATWRQARVAATAPAGAATAVVTETAAVKVGTPWLSTACAYTRATSATASPTPTTGPTPGPTTAPTSTPTSTSTSAPPPGGSGDGTQAATLLHWGSSVDGDEFNGTKLDSAKWGAYEGAGHDGKGRRVPSQISVGGGMLTISGTSNGSTGGMAARSSHLHGRWETRMRVPRGDADYHPVLILWPVAEDWPQGGEVDYAETTAASSKVEFFLHYSSSNKQTYGSKSIDLTQWHNYAVDWTASGVRGYIDGQLWFTDTNSSHVPPRKMQQTIQLDWFPGGGSTTPSSMQVDWTRYYAP